MSSKWRKHLLVWHRFLGKEADVKHWQSLVRTDPDHVRLMFDQRWEMNGIEKYFAGPKEWIDWDELILGNAFAVFPERIC